MIAIACTLLSAAGFYLSLGLGHQWWLLWIAPVPVLWLSFGRIAGWKAFLAAWAAFALGLSNLTRAYGGVFPAPILAFDILLPSVPFAAATIGARRVANVFGPVGGMLSFAALWAGLDLLLSLDPAMGSMVSPASTQVGAPLLIQSAALVGFPGVTFLLGTAAAGIALSLRTRNPTPVLIAVALFTANVAYGGWRVSHRPPASLRVALLDSNAYGYWAPAYHEHQSTAAAEANALQVIDAYAAQIEQLRGRGVQLVVLPENIAAIAPAWRDQAWTRLRAAAAAAGATVIGGFNMVRDGALRNLALAFAPGAAEPSIYEKRRLVPVAESSFFSPGQGPLVLPDGAGVEICLDMDSGRMIRRDAVATRPRFLAVPASEIGTHGDWTSPAAAADAWFHARDAMLRSVENGVPMARSAQLGLLTLSDRYGRITAQARTVGGFTTLVGELPLSGRGGTTPYDRIGDAFGWLCLALGVGLLGASWRRRSAVMGAATACALLLCAVAVCLPQSAAAAGAFGSPYHVGVAHRTFLPKGPYDWRGAKTHALLATVWYPAVSTAREDRQWIGPPAAPIAGAGEAAPEAALARAPRRFPLIVISHGTGGTASAMAWLGTRLAARGFIAVAVNHPGNTGLEPYTPQGFTLWWLRARDLRAVIDGMLADREFGHRIDARRIGAAGFSLGGYTMIEVAGGRTSPAFFSFCAQHLQDPRCASPPEFPTLGASVARLMKTDPRYRAAVREASDSYRDPRVRAVFAIAPALGAVFVPDSLTKIAVPVEIVAGSADPIEPVAGNAKYFAAHIPGSRLVLFPGAGHYTFSATCTADGRRAQPALCIDPPGIDRHRIHQRTADLAVTFFSRRLN
jgi:predicted dienelactone hydrolase/apolipoprotein N-acyltransferase